MTIEDSGDTLYFSHDGSNALFESWGNFLMKDISAGNALTTVTIEGNGSGNAELKIKDGQYSGSYTSLAQTNQTFEIDYGSSGTTTDLFNINPDGQDVDVQFEGTTNTTLLFLDAGTDKVGIGTASPGSRLEVKGTTDDNTAAALNAMDSAGTSLIYARNDGNVGVGTIIPDQKLSVSDISSMTQAIFGQDRTTGYSQITIGEKAAADSAFSIGYDHDNNYGYMQVAGDAVGSGLVVADGGQVGIGTTPTTDLDVSGIVKLRNVTSGFVESDASGNLSTQKILHGRVDVGDVNGGSFDWVTCYGDIIQAYKSNGGGQTIIQVWFTGFGHANYTATMTVAGTSPTANADNDLEAPIIYDIINGYFIVLLHETAGGAQNIRLHFIIMSD